MSSYEDYGKASDSYDDTRVAVGTEILLGAFAAGAVPLSEIDLLDAGCGTGTYAAAVASKVGTVTLLDASDAMLAVARQKLGSAQRFEYRVGQLQDLPFADSSFDAVMTNQVLHHIGDVEGAGWPEHERVFSEYARVLRPGGVLVVNTCSQLQLAQGYWYYALIPEAAEQLRRRYAPLDVIEQIAAAKGLVVTGRFVPVDVPIQGSAYLDGSAPLSASWRLGDSTWSLAGAREMAEMTQRVTALGERGDLEAFVAEHDADREAIGQITFIVARSAPSA
jgi:ubiquinone/menaquinone biosynthesis C-methylase UbiE